ncbi:class I SAM-dependent methyltransferase [Halococcus salifodinae]|uniref:Type 11 methyltransferase n=1 Tax=Halococcus salifodinae DSM 8989 TaxID=1227456 RepID=M0N9Q4_9EURY|nr:class I SAM-dependent methyltransferase [Halococcus salifodinae]EMA54687.1 type 11 methyltransferase [Halococcus salifodinae DSM 8989]
MYNFGLYHWRRRLRTILTALAVILPAGVCQRTSESRWIRLVATAAMFGGAVHGATAVRRLLSPPPWALDREPYAALASALPFAGADHALDIGCGTGRSLVGLAPSVPDSCTLLGLDVFDDRIILGNGAALARRNGRAAGVDIAPIVGGASRLPVATGSQDVVTACRVLHDLPAAEVDPALREAHHVCAPEGTLGVLELPIVPGDTTATPEEYWPDRITQAGFTVTRVERVGREGRAEPYILVGATP